MGKLTVSISDETERELRAFVATSYPLKPFGKLSDVVERAIREYLGIST